MVYVAPGKTFAARCVIQFVSEIAVFGVEQKMDEHGESREYVHGFVERCEPRRSYVWLLVHGMKKVLGTAGSRNKFARVSLLRRGSRTNQSGRLDVVQLGPAFQQIRIALLLQLVLVW